MLWRGLCRDVCGARAICWRSLCDWKWLFYGPALLVARAARLSTTSGHGAEGLARRRDSIYFFLG